MKKSDKINEIPFYKINSGYKYLISVLLDYNHNPIYGPKQKQAIDKTIALTIDSVEFKQDVDIIRKEYHINVNKFQTYSRKVVQHALNFKKICDNAGVKTGMGHFDFHGMNSKYIDKRDALAVLYKNLDKQAMAIAIHDQIASLRITHGIPAKYHMYIKWFILSDEKLRFIPIISCLSDRIFYCIDEFGLPSLLVRIFPEDGYRDIKNIWNDISGCQAEYLGEYIDKGSRRMAKKIDRDKRWHRLFYKKKYSINKIADLYCEDTEVVRKAISRIDIKIGH